MSSDASPRTLSRFSLRSLMLLVAFAGAGCGRPLAESLPSDQKQIGPWREFEGKFLDDGPILSPDESRLVLISPNEKSVRVWDMKSGMKLYEFKGERFRLANFSPDGRYLLTVDSYSKVSVRSAIDGSIISQIRSKELLVGTVRISSDGERLITESSDHRWDVEGTSIPRMAKPGDVTVTLWDLDSGNDIASVKAWSSRDPDPWVVSTSATTLTPDGKRFITTQDDGKFEFWDLATGQLHKSVTVGSWPRGSEAGDWRTIRIATDGNTVICLSAQGCSVFDLTTGKLQIKIECNDSRISIFTGDSKRLLTDHEAEAETDRVVRVRSVRSGEVVAEHKIKNGSVRKLSASADGRYVVIQSYRSCSLWDTLNNQILLKVPSYVTGNWVTMEQWPEAASSISPSGRPIIASKGKVRIWIGNENP